MATWVHESPSDLVPALSVSRTAKFSVLVPAPAAITATAATSRAIMADAAVKPADVVMTESAAAAAPDAAPAPKQAEAKAASGGKKKGGGKQKGGGGGGGASDAAGATEVPAKKGTKAAAVG